MISPVQGKASRDVAIGIGITTLVVAVSVSMPVLGFFTSLVIPLPVLYFRSKLGRNLGTVMTAGALGMGLVLFQGLSLDTLFFSALILLGFLMGEFFDRRYGVELTLGLTCAGVFFTIMTAAVMLSNAQNLSLTVWVSDYIAANLRLTLKLYEGVGVSPENIYRLSNSLDEIQYALVRILPSLILAGALFISWLNLLLARTVFLVKGLAYPDFGALNRWKSPDPLVWGVIGCGLIIFIADGSLKLVAVNGLIVLMSVYFLQGIAVVSFFFEKKRLPLFFRVVFYSLICVQQFLLLLVIGLGFFDIWINFRKLEADPPEGGDVPQDSDGTE